MLEYKGSCLLQGGLFMSYFSFYGELLIVLFCYQIMTLQEMWDGSSKNFTAGFMTILWTNGTQL